MSSTILNNNNKTTLESSQKVQYDTIYSNTKILSNKEKYILKKQFIQIIPSYLKLDIHLTKIIKQQKNSRIRTIKKNKNIKNTITTSSY